MNRYFLILASLILVNSCKEEKTVITNNDLVGKWDVYLALRNGKATKTMDSAYFLFKDDNSVESNVFQYNEKKTYSVNNSKLAVKGSEHFDLNISDMHNDSLHLTGKMWYFDMDFFLKRSK